MAWYRPRICCCQSSQVAGRPSAYQSMRSTLSRAAAAMNGCGAMPRNDSTVHLAESPPPMTAT